MAYSISFLKEFSKTIFFIIYTLFQISILLLFYVRMIQNMKILRTWKVYSCVKNNKAFTTSDFAIKSISIFCTIFKKFSRIFTLKILYKMFFLKRNI